MEFNRETVKLGCRPSIADDRTLKFSDYLVGPLPAAPAATDWLKADPTPGMLLNDRLGDCVIAGMMHMDRYQSANAGRAVLTPTNAEVISAYSAIGGYVDDDPSTDNGCDPLTALKYWRSTGLTMAGNNKKILAFMQVNPENFTEFWAALWMFGGLFAGWVLPTSAEGRAVWIDEGDPTLPDSPYVPGSWGGHLAPLGAEAIQNVRFPGFKVSTWGESLPVSRGFINTYCDEVWAVLMDDWFADSNLAPSGFDLPQLEADLALV